MWPPHAPPLTPTAGTDDGSGQVSDSPADTLAYSCGHSAGFSPASLGPEPVPAARGVGRSLSSKAPSVRGRDELQAGRNQPSLKEYVMKTDTHPDIIWSPSR